MIYFIKELDVNHDSGSYITIRAKVGSSSGGDPKEIEEYLSAPVKRIDRLRFTNYGGEGCSQQSVHIEVWGTNSDGMHEIQVEVDMKTGEFEEDSLDAWEYYE